MNIKNLIIAAALATSAAACVPYDACPGETNCDPNATALETQYCCPAADVCIAYGGSYECYGYGDVANGQPKADAVGTAATASTVKDPAAK